MVISYSGYYKALIRLGPEFNSQYHHQIIDAEWQEYRIATQDKAPVALELSYF